MNRHAPAVAALLCAGVFWFRNQDGIGDMESVLRGALALWYGLDPYVSVRLGPFPMVYPLTGLLLAWPIAILPWSSVGIMGLSGFVYLRGVLRDHPYAWLGLVSAAGYTVLHFGQWSMLLTGAALIPSLGFLLTIKPTMGCALFLAYPSWRGFYGIAAIGLLSLAVDPWWPLKWLENTAEAPHMRAPVQYWGGPFLLLSALAWRTPEGRLLALLSCVPQTSFLYDTLPLFLIPRTLHQSVGLVVGSWFVFAAATPLTYWLYPDMMQWQHWDGFAGRSYVIGLLQVWCLYLPCLGIVLARQVEGFTWTNRWTAAVTGSPR